MPVFISPGRTHPALCAHKHPHTRVILKHYNTLHNTVPYRNTVHNNTPYRFVLRCITPHWSPQHSTARISSDTTTHKDTTLYCKRSPNNTPTVPQHNSVQHQTEQTTLHTTHYSTTRHTHHNTNRRLRQHKQPDQPSENL